MPASKNRVGFVLSSKVLPLALWLANILQQVARCAVEQIAESADCIQVETERCPIPQAVC